MIRITGERKVIYKELRRKNVIIYDRGQKGFYCRHHPEKGLMTVIGAHINKNHMNRDEVK